MDIEDFQYFIDQASKVVGSNICVEPGCDQQTFNHMMKASLTEEYCEDHQYKKFIRSVSMPTKTKAQRRKRQLVIYMYTIWEMRDELRKLRARVNQLEQKYEGKNYG